AALNSIEPSLMNVALIDIFHANEEWARLRRPGAVEFMHKRLKGLSNRLGDQLYLDGERFTAGDLIMASVLRILPQHTREYANLAAYLDRCIARPAFERALASQLADFRQQAA